MVFEKTLTDVVKGIRASKRDTAVYISTVIAEIRNEIHSTDPHTKANALQKLTFLQMMGYNMSWASFPTIEVMSSTRFAYKRIGYLAAIQAFTQDTEVILLATNLLKKELRGAVGPGMQGVYEAGLAINCLANIVTEDLAQDLLPEVTDLITHPQPYLRKKALLCLFKIFVKFPQALRLTFGRIQQTLLQDTHPSVVSCAVNVITELSDKNPKNYLPLAPTFFDLLTKSNNNWMLIKVVKLLGSLVSEEPRLARKLLEPLSKIVQSTQAKSLLYEAVYTITLCLPYCRKSDGSMPSSIPAIVELCANTLKDFVQDSDQNLKYLGLVGFGSLMVSHPKVLSAPDYRPLILACLSDEDVTIRKRALDLLVGMATRKNIMELVTQLLRHVDLATGRYKADLLVKILDICSSEKYSLIPDFAWYVDILVILARTRGIGGFVVHDNERLGDFVSSLILDIGLRVLPIRAYLVRRMIGILLEKSVEHAAARITSKELQRHGVIYDGQYIVQEVLSAAAWIVGEYSTLIIEALAIHSDGEQDEDELHHYNARSAGTFHALIQALTEVTNVDTIVLTTQSIFIQASAKILAAASLEESKVKNDEIEACLITLSTTLPIYMQSLDAEVQERAFTFFHFLSSLGLVSPTQNYMDQGLRDDTKLGRSDAFEQLTGLSHIKTSFIDTSRAEVFRQNSLKFKQLYISEPMKPASSKSQQKKRLTVTGRLQTLLNKPVDYSILTSLIADDKIQRPKSIMKNYMEDVSFTQQKMKTVPHPIQDTFVDGNSGLNSTDKGNGSQTIPSNIIRHHDPFYLNTSTRGNAPDNTSGDSGAKRFGTIQLDGSEDEGLKQNDRRKSKKSRKRGKNHENVSSASVIMPSMPSHQIYLSDNDSGDEKGTTNKAKSQLASLREFEGLASVDLTQPLREDEVISRRVQRNISEVNKPETIEYGNEKKKKKKEKIAKQGKPSVNGLGTTTVDLLDLASFTIADTHVKNMDQPMASYTNSTVLSNGMEDLLSLNLPTKESLTTPVSVYSRKESGSSVSNSNSNETELWQELKLKTSQVKGSGNIIDWDRVSILYRTVFSKECANKVIIAFRLVNKNETSVLSNGQLHICVTDTVITFPDTQPGTSCRSSIKAGPFTMTEDPSSKEVRGNFTASGWVVPFKLFLPSVGFLLPTEDVSMEEISEELAKVSLHQFNIKLSVSKSFDPIRIKALLKFFLRAVEASSDKISSSISYILVSTSARGRVFLFVKIGDGVIKIDVKTSDEHIGQCLSSDLKRVRFVER